MSDALAQLSAAGVSIWLDDISRERLRTGNLQDLVDTKNVVGVTSNPTIFQKALEKGAAYDEQARDLALRKTDTDEAIRYFMAYDIRWACDVLRPVYDATNGQDGRVSIEVDPRLAHDADRTIAEANGLWWLVDRPNVMIKIPATQEGLPAITAAIAAGISVNVTLIFGLERYEKVMDAYLTGLVQARERGIDLSTIHSVASFFVSRVDSEIDKRLDKIGSDEAKALRGKAAVANARLAYQLFEGVLASDRWKALAESAVSATDPLARQGAFETYVTLMKDIGTPIEPFIANVLSTILDKCSDKVHPLNSAFIVHMSAQCISLVVNLQAGYFCGCS